MKGVHRIAKLRQMKKEKNTARNKTMVAKISAIILCVSSYVVNTNKQATAQEEVIANCTNAQNEYTVIAHRQKFVNRHLRHNPVANERNQDNDVLAYEALSTRIWNDQSFAGGAIPTTGVSQEESFRRELCGQEVATQLRKVQEVAEIIKVRTPGTAARTRRGEFERGDRHNPILWYRLPLCGTAGEMSVNAKKIRDVNGRRAYKIWHGIVDIRWDNATACNLD